MTLPLRKILSCTGKDRLILLRQIRNKRCCIGQTSSTLHCIQRSIFICISKIITDRFGKKHSILKNDTDKTTQTAQRIRTDIPPVQQDLPFIHFVKAHQQIDNRRFPGTCRTDQRHLSSRPDDQVKIVNDALPRHIRKTHMAKFDHTAEIRRNLLPALSFSHFVQYMKNPLSAGQRCFNLPIELGHLMNRPGKLLRINDERRNNADGNPSFEDKVGAKHRNHDKGAI